MDKVPHAASQHASWSARQRRRMVDGYLVLVVSLAAFLALCVGARPAVRAYVAEAEIYAPSALDLKSELTPLVELAAARQFAIVAAPVSDAPRAENRAVAKHAASSASEPSAKLVRYRVRARAADQIAAVDGLHQAMQTWQQRAAAQEQARQEQRRALALQIDEARRDEQDSSQAIQVFLQNHPRPELPAALPQRLAPPAPAVNPAWEALRQRHAATAREQARLLREEGKTPEHPQVVQLTMDLERMEAELAHAPPAFASPETEHRLPRLDESQAAATAAARRALAQWEADRAALLQRQQQAGQTLAALSEAMLQAAAAPEIPLPVIHAGARFAGRETAPIRGWRLAWLLAIALAAGLAALMLVRTWEDRQPWRSMAHVREALEIPIAAALCSRDAEIPPLVGWSNPRLWLARGSEAAVAAAIAATLLLIAAGQLTPADIAHDPFGALAQSLAGERGW